MNWRIFIFWFIFSWCGTAHVNAVYTDCEHPPTILHGKTELNIDEEGIQVTALYTCENGYQIHGESQLKCDTDTDEWEGELPACKLETGNNSTVSEIEPTEIVDAVATVAPEVTHEEIVNTINQIVSGDTNEIEEIVASIPSNPEQTLTTATAEVESVPSTEATKQKKRRRKGKISDAQEDNNIDYEFASRLDMSCIEGIAAPSVNDAYVLEYIRGRKGDHEFLVAVYACDEDFELENPQANRLYCSNENWIGNHPVCMSRGENDLDYNGGDDVDDENDENVDNNNNNNESNNAYNGIDGSHIKTESESNSLPPIENVAENDENNGMKPQTEPPRIEDHNELGQGTISCEINNGGCEQLCSTAQDDESGSMKVECSCNEGFYLDSIDGKGCVDVNECENPDIEQTCPNGCENTVGSYRCAPQSPEIELIPTNEVDERQNRLDHNSPVKTCGDGLELDASNNCIDIDECQLGNTGCEYCQNSFGGFQCTCPDGFELNADEKTCRDIDECVTFSDYEYEENTPTARSICSHECINTIGSYICKCPENHHLQSNKRTCERDFCRHLGDVDSNKTKCSHDCVDDVSGYQCMCPSGMELDADMKTCKSQDACALSGDRCLPGKCIPQGDSFGCDCPVGFAAHNQRCIDYDECAIGTHKCSHKCKNIDGSYLCECPDDLILAADQHKCVSSETDLCEQDNGGCSDICNVVDEEVVCSCPEGAQLDSDGQSCRSINICESNNGGCQQVCNAEINRCECFPGFETLDNGRTCRDLNECLQSNGGCSQQCVNTDGGYECECFSGFEKDPETDECSDIDECAENNGNCNHDCSNTDGSYKCVCRQGYRLADNQHQCLNIDECETLNGGCSHICTDLQGSHECSCPEGQFLSNDNHTCDFINVCETDNGGCSHKCNYERGVLNCSCPVGYELDETGKNCVDRNECLELNGGCSHQCENLIGSHVCKCNVGYQLGSDKGTCIDVDECIEDNGNCSNICINLLGSYLCACETGYELDVDKHSCIDINECADAIHDCAQICINVPGAYECDCAAGYRRTRDHFGCEDIDECSLPNSCSDASKCVNTIGSYYCNCPPGFELSPNKTCVDVDECNGKQCSHHCENTLGSFKCVCPIGMELASDSITCVDINECVLNVGICSHSCDNVEGSFKCRCPDGFELADDQVNCKDIDECANADNECDQLCVNTEGNFKCECNVYGFELAPDNRKCISSDPCGIKNGGCAHVCEPMNGKAVCFCYKGFELSADNSSCVDIDECLLNHGCENKCVNTIGSYKCEKKCPKGFRLNEFGSCVDINECVEQPNGGCSPNSECINFSGSFRCICPTGFLLDHDKVTCIEIKDSCAAIAAPENGDVRCIRSRHLSQYFYKTKCSIWCNEGFTLIGPSIYHCNGSDGLWDSMTTECVPSSCPALLKPEFGVISPPECLKGKMYPGESCTLSCLPGYKTVGAESAQCLPGLRWSTTNLKCSAIKSTPKTRIQQGGTHSRGHINLEQRENVGHQAQNILRPYIKCPRDTTIILPKNKKTVYVKLEQPKSNVDFANHVSANPPWAKNLQAHLAAGVHVITFQARSPNAASVTETCRTVLTVKSTVIAATAIAHGPDVVYCPPNMEIHLQSNELQRAVFWKEPAFRSNQHLKQIFKSNLPGARFGVGMHKITYIATDLQGQNGTCEFSVIVRPSGIGRMINGQHNQYNQQHSQHNQHNQHIQHTLDNHESYLLCPGKPVMKLDTSFPMHIPNGCFIKNVRLRHYNPHRRRNAFSPNNNFLRYYSSWNRPEYLRYY